MAFAVVQSTSGSGSGTGLTSGQTLSGSPVTGNLLVFAVNTGNSTVPTTFTFDTTKWFFIDVAISSRLTDQVITLLGRYVQAGDTTTMPAFCTAGSGFFSYEGYEISGVSATFATSFLCSSTNQVKSGTSLSTFKQHAVANGSLGLVFYAKYNETSAGTAPSGWTSDINTVNSGNYGSFGCAHLAMNAGDPAQATFVAASGGANTFGIIQLILTPSQPAYPIVKRSATRVNNATSGFPGTLFFGGTPFTGDLMRAYVGWQDGSSAAPTVNTGGGWANDTNALNGSNPIMLGLNRYVQIGDTNTLPALCTAGSAFWDVTFVEIGPATALSGTFATDHKSAKSAYQASGSTLTTTSDSTTTNSSLCTTAFTEYGASSAGSNTGADQNANALDFGAYGWWAGSQIVNATSGTACQTVWTLSSSSDKSGYIQDIWKGIPVGETSTGVLSFGGLAFNTSAKEQAAKTIVITSGTTWSVPGDWNNSNNSVEALGAGGNGSAGVTATSSGAGAGGGAYSKALNVVLTPGSSVSIQIGTGGTGNGTNNDSFLKDNSGTARVLAQSAANASGISHGNGGLTTRAVGSITNGGGNGGNGTAVSGRGGGGGGSTAGPTGAGALGGTGNNASGAGGGGADGGSAGANSAAVTGGAGGNNAAGSGSGAGGTTVANAQAGTNGGGGGGGSTTATHQNGATGGDEALWTDSVSLISYGPSGGAGGGSTIGNGANGGQYGGGGAGGGDAAGSAGSGGTGGNGLLVIKYVPIENASGTLTFSGIAITGSSKPNHKGTGVLSFSGLSFLTSSSVKNFATGLLHFGALGFNAAGTSVHTPSHGVLSFAGISIIAAGGPPSFQATFAEFKDEDFLDWGSADYTSFMDISQTDNDVDVKEQVPYLYTFLKETPESDADSEGAMLTGYWDWANDPTSPRVTEPVEIYRFRDGFLLSATKHKFRGRGRQLQLHFESESGKNFNLLGWAVYYNRNVKQ